MPCLRARPVDHARTITPAEHLNMGHRLLSIGPCMAPSYRCCDADSGHTHIRVRLGAQVNQHQPLIHALLRTLEQ